MIAFLLWFLATIDAAFTGYREAAGRNALINKRGYYLKAMLRGALLGQIGVIFAGIFIALAIRQSNESSKFVEQLNNIGARMLSVYLPFASIIILALIVRLFPSVDVKSITSTVIFGPFTLFRPFVAVGGMIYGLFAAPNFKTILLGALVLVLMLGLEWGIGQLRTRRHIS